MTTTIAEGIALLLGLAAFLPPTTAGAPPAAPELEGSWTWTWKDRQGNTHKHVLEVEGKGKTLAAREVFDDQEPVRVNPLTVDGNSVRFTVVRGERKAEYRGKVADADHVNGTVLVTVDGQTNEFEWKAERKKTATR